MVELGQYNRADPLITSNHFPTKRSGKTELAIGLVCFGFLISTENAFTAFHLMHFRPVEIRELIAFDEKYFCLHRRFPIAAIGSVWQSSDGYRYIPYVSRGDTGRKLELEPGRERNEVWDGIFHFAVVRD